MSTPEFERAASRDGSIDPRACTISLIATVRNERDSIETFIESLLTQSRKPDEIIIVDGESTDGTREILERYQRAKQIRLISKRCNIAEGRNLAIRDATGDWIAATDAGCLVDHDWLKNLAHHIEGPSAPDVVAGNFRCQFESPFEEAVAAATFVPGREHAQQNLFPSSRSVAFKKSAWTRAKGYPEWLYAAEDTLLNIRFRQLGFKFVFARDAYVYWRPRSSWRALAKQRFNFARGNARIGFGTHGYFLNLRYHLSMLAPLIGGLVWPPLALLALFPLMQHIRRNLWRQAVVAARDSETTGMFSRVLIVMEFVRLVNLAGFLAGRWDRLADESFVRSQLRWMGASSVDESAGQIAGASGPGEMDTADIPARATGIGKRALKALVRLDTIRTRAVWICGAIGTAALLAPPLATFSMGLSLALATAAAITILLAAKSIRDFSRTGPQITKEIRSYYAIYSLLALGRLIGWAFGLITLFATLGFAVYGYLVLAGILEFHIIWGLVAALGGVALVTTLQFCRHLLYVPGTIAASSHYRLSRLYPLWRSLSPLRLAAASLGAYGLAAALVATALIRMLAHDQVLYATLASLGLTLTTLALVLNRVRPAPAAIREARDGPPNILMIGSDTLRADRLGAAGYHRSLTPFMDSLALRGTQFTSCYVPCARTAPSLVSLFTGNWPHTHGIRDNFISDEETRLTTPALPSILAEHGYQTVAVSDWCGADLGKFQLGFTTTDLPEDQWNIKYLIRQGPKDLRLFLTLFTRNAFGKRFIPELYYLAGVPLTNRVGDDACRAITRLAADGKPFLLNVFMSTTHPPFSSEYPYYTLHANASYGGESKFAMTRLADPWDIIRRQGDSRQEFDLDQIIDLYDGCVSNFDDQCKRIVEHLEASGLGSNTIIVIYSDHGMELFEHDTWGQGNSVRGDFSSRIPLIIAGPGVQMQSACEEIVRSIDIAPTLLELVGLKYPAAIDGASLAPYLRGERTSLNLPAFNETGIWLADVPGMPRSHLRYPNLFELLEVPDKRSGTLAIKAEFRNAVIVAKDRMVRVGSWKLIYQPTVDGPLYALFDVASDPECRVDLAAQRPDVVQQLRAILARWMDEAADSGSQRNRQFEPAIMASQAE